MNFVFGALVEIVAYLGANFLLSSRFGRRHSMVMYQFSAAAMCAALGVLTLASDEHKWKFYAVIVIAILGKGFSASSIVCVFLYVTELFPTSARGTALGVCGACSRLGTMIAPQIMFLVRVSDSR